MMENMNNGDGSSAVELDVKRALAERDEAVGEARAQGTGKTPEEAAFLDGLQSEWLATDAIVPAPAGAWRRRPILRLWVPMTAVAAAMLFGVWLGRGTPGGLTGGQGSTTLGPTTQGPSGVYLGDEIAAEQVFDGTVDWSESAAAPTICQIIIRDADATQQGEASIVHREDFVEGSTWTCPPDVLDKLTPRIIVEVYDLTAPTGSAPAWTGIYRLP